jgi:hypothetical protein
VIAGVLDGSITTGRAAVALQGHNVLLRAEKLALDIHEHLDLSRRVEELEGLLERREGDRWGA